MSKVGIVIRGYGLGEGGSLRQGWNPDGSQRSGIDADELLRLTLKSIERAKKGTPLTVSVPDDSYGNEEITRLLKDTGLTHICLLRAGMIVTDGWLDALTNEGMDLAAPVMNHAENEQNVAIDIEPALDDTAFVEVNGFAQKRTALYGGLRQQSESVSLAAAVLKREVIEAVGLPDEAFRLSPFESDDYCLRLRRADFRIWIVRDCFIYAPPQAGFASSQARASAMEEYRPLFEEKWSAQWKDPGAGKLESIMQDWRFLMKSGFSTPWSLDMLGFGARDFKRSYEAQASRIAELEERTRYLEARLGDELSFGENARQIKSKIRRRLSPTKRAEGSGGDRAGDVAKEAIEFLRNNACKPVAVFAPMFTTENVLDGYMQRVKAVDDEVLNGYLKIYLQLQEPELSPGFSVVDEKHLCVWLDPRETMQAKALLKIVRHCEMAYIHSVLRIMKDIIPDRLRDELFSKGRQRLVWDVHGVVPEEFEAQGDYYKSQTAGEAEGFLAQKTDMAIVVSEAMGRHLEKKYGDRLKAVVKVMPIFNAESLKPVDCFSEKSVREGRKPLAVYAGGLQKWQKIDEMQDLISAARILCRYAVFCPRPEEFLDKWGIRPRPASLRVERKSADEIKEEYKYCHYGFSLRDDITVNNVACPTKLIEYIQYGVVPVLDTPNIGDFRAMGLEYVSHKAFADGDLPEEAKRRRMAENNYGILKKLTDMYLEGKASVLSSLAADRKAGDKANEGGVNTGHNESQQAGYSESQKKGCDEGHKAGRKVNLKAGQKSEKEKRSIALVVGSFDKGGLEQVVLNLYLGYKKKGWNAYILSQHNLIGPMAGKLLDPKDLFVFDSDSSAFKHFCHKRGINTLHYHYNTFLLEEACKSGFTVLYTMHNIYTWMDDQEIQDYSRKLSSAHKVIPVSGFVERYYLARTGAPADNIHTILNGVDFEGLDERHETLPVTRKSLGFEDEDIVVAGLASFHPVKHQIGMIGVMERLYSSHPEIKLLLVGNEGDPDYYRAFSEALEDSPAKENIRVVPYFDHRYVGQFLREEVDIFALASLQEGCSNAVLEAIYCAKPMLLTDVGNAGEVKGVAGCEVVPPPYEDILALSPEGIKDVSLRKENANTQELADALLRIAENLDAYKGKAAKAAERAGVYSAAHMVEQYADIIMPL